MNNLLEFIIRETKIKDLKRKVANLEEEINEIDQISKYNLNETMIEALLIRRKKLDFERLKAELEINKLNEEQILFEIYNNHFAD